MPANRIGCDEFRGTLARPDRRAFVKAGAFGAGALTLNGLLRAEAGEAQGAYAPRSGGYFPIVGLKSSVFTRNAHWSATSSMIFVVGLPAP